MTTVRELRGPQTGTPLTEYAYTYDNLDRLTSVTDTANYGANWQSPNTVASLPVVLTYSYNAVGDLNQTSAAVATSAAPTTPVADYVNSYQYDNLGRMNRVVQSGTAALGQPAITRKRVDIAYNPMGAFSKIVRSSGAAGSETETATSTYSYFAGGGLKQIDHTHSGTSLTLGAPPTGLPISSYSWTFDAASRVSSFTAPEGTVAYGYDNTNQLTSATFTTAIGYSGGTPSSESFNFDATGNRTGTGYTVSHNRLTSDGTFNYTYDNEGNLLTKTEIATGKVTNYTWDHRNRLIKVEFRNSATGPVTKTVVNVYDVYDHRVMKQVDDNSDGVFDRTERYVWDGEDIALVLDENGHILHRFLHGPAIDQLFADESSVDGLLWDLGDNQNTTRDVINNSGSVINHVTYSPFGKIASESNPAKTPFFAYTGRDWDEDLQLQYNRRRWYDPATGRWLTEDPIGFGAGDTNIQRYLANNPEKRTDPTGLVVRPDGYSITYSATIDDGEQIRTVEYTVSVGLYLAPNRGDVLADAAKAVAAQYNARVLGISEKEIRYSKPIRPEDIQRGQRIEVAVCVGMALLPSAGPRTSTPRSAPTRPRVAGTPKPANIAPETARPKISTSLPDRVTKPLPEGQSRTPTENSQARNFFERNRELAKRWWEERTGQKWPDNFTHYEHPRPLADGGDPLFVEPGFGGSSAPHMVPGQDGLTDFQRWGRLGGRPPSPE